MDNQLSTTLQSLAAGGTALQSADYPPRSIGPGYHLINSKLKPPHTTAACVERRSLIGRVTRASRKRLLVLSAPIGSGKTTLLSQWYRHALPTRSLAWLSLDEQDCEPMRFFVYLAGAVSSAVGNFEACVAGHLPGSGAISLDPAATALAEALCRIEQDLTIVLDDIQWIGDPALTRAFCFLLQHSPPNIHWIVSGRCMPDLDLSRLRLQDQLAIIDGADLSFTVANIAQLSRKLCRHGLSLQEATRVRNCTEGWWPG